MDYVSRLVAKLPLNASGNVTLVSATEALDQTLGSEPTLPAGSAQDLLQSVAAAAGESQALSVDLIISLATKAQVLI